MMKRKTKLERAIILSLILSTGVCSSAGASDVAAIYNDDKSETATETINVGFHNGTDATNTGNIVLNGPKEGGGAYNVSITTTNGDVNLNAPDNISYGSGILIAANEEMTGGAEVTLNAAGNININNGNGIKANSMYTSDIVLKAGNTINITASDIGIYSTGATNVELIAKNNVITATNYAIKTDANSKGYLTVTAQDYNANNTISATGENGVAVRANGSKIITVKAESGYNFITGTKNGIQHDETGKLTDESNFEKDADTKYVNVKSWANTIWGGENAIISDGKGIVEIEATYANNTIGRYKDENGETHISETGIKVSEGIVNLKSKWYQNEIFSNQYGIKATGTGEGEINMSAGSSGSNEIYATDAEPNKKSYPVAISTDEGSKININLIAKGSAYGTSNNKITSDNNGIDHLGNGKITLIAKDNNQITTDYGDGIRTFGEGIGEVELKAKNNTITSTGDCGIYSLNKGTVSLIENDTNDVTGKTGIYASAGTKVKLKGTKNNVYGGPEEIEDGSTLNKIYKGMAVKVVDANIGTSVDILGQINNMHGTVQADGANAVVNIGGDILNDGSLAASSANNIASSAKIDGIATAVLAKNSAVVNIKAESNRIVGADTQKSSQADYVERVVWAKLGSTINIDGSTYIVSDSHKVVGLDTESGQTQFITNDELAKNANSIAIAAGEVNKVDGVDRSRVNINYNGQSYIEGDIVSGYNGEIGIKKTSGTNKNNLTLYGNALAANEGEVSIDLGEGGIWLGRSDDYSDVKTGKEEHGATVYKPAFSEDISEKGTVDLTMGDSSKWYLQGQSWISSINTKGADNTLIDLVSRNTDYKTNAHALTIGKLIGDTTFKMNLNRDRSVSDMLYIQQAEGEYLIQLEEAVTDEDLYADGFDGLRFATIGKGSKASFKVVSKENGVYNVSYLIGQDTNTEESHWENSHYNHESTDTEKPGKTSVSNMLTSNNYTGEGNDGTFASEGYTPAITNGTDDLNVKLILPQIDELSDAGETVLNMSRANYSNAIYMDRLNKRMGEARYINDEEDQGMWVRIRHDRIGKKDAFSSQNSMYELGYDEKQECDNGKRRVGFAVDYMHGDTGYSDIAGKGEIDRYGLWLYDTWTGNKGHYADYVAKWGHIDNEFEIYTPTKGEKVTGDYTNNVFSISAEYGRKKDMGNDWYFEPQVQAQLARVTGADYVTSQGTKVSVEGINSLIGRAGFRLGKDFGTEKQSTFYVKADVLHEFLGDQDIRALDATTNGNWSKISYENEGTWYDVGIGFAAMMSKTSYAFLDLERSFGHDNDETWQINAGLRWEW